VWVLDNDVAGVLVSAPTIVLAENTSATYSVVLGTQPTAGVTVNVGLSLGGASDLVVAPTSLAFATATWNVPQVRGAPCGALMD
jgi:hypothetical protein